MTTHALTPRDRIDALRGRDLVDLHNAGSTPELEQLHGPIDGDVLRSPLVHSLRLWRGKVFMRADEGHLTGLNRISLTLGFGETRRYRFEATIGPSAFADRRVLLLNHDLDGNPGWVRRFHDEVVQIEPGLLLATSHHRAQDGHLKHLCYFALAWHSGTAGQHPQP